MSARLPAVLETAGAMFGQPERVGELAESLETCPLATFRVRVYPAGSLRRSVRVDRRYSMAATYRWHRRCGWSRRAAIVLSLPACNW